MTGYQEVTTVTFRDAVRLSTLADPNFREDLARAYDRSRMPPPRSTPKPGWRRVSRVQSLGWNRKWCRMVVATPWIADVWERVDGSRERGGAR